MRYLLPCSCGRNIEVDAGQAGLALTCACGAKLEVPTMRGLSLLERVPEPASATAARAPWGPRQGLMFLGTALLAVGLGLTAYFGARVPPEPTPDPAELANLQEQVDSIPPSRMLEIWEQQFKPGIGMPITETHEAYRRLLSERRLRMTLSLGLAGAGLLLLGVGSLYKSEARGGAEVSSRQPTAARPSP